jgi:hypothetical protein
MGGGGSFTVHLPFQVLAAPSVGWTEVAGPHAAYANGRTYIVGIGGQSNPNDVLVYAYVHATNTVEGLILLHNALTPGTVPDTHMGGAVLVRPDGHVVVAYCGHNGSSLVAKISTDPWDITAGFGSAITINSAGLMTYPQLSQINDRIWCTWRNRTGAGSASIFRNHSDDGGATWGSDENLYEVSADTLYSAFACNGSRIDYAVTDKEPDAGDYGLWHFYMEEDGSIFKSDGTEFAASLPLATSDLTQIVPTGNDSYPYSVSYTADGRPVIACQTKTVDPVEIFEYRWSGSAWARHDIDTSEPLLPGVNSIGGGAHDWGDSLRFLTGKVISGNIYVYLYTSTDDGETWTPRLIDTASSAPSPVYVKDAGSQLTWIWFASGFTDSDTFDPEIAGVA